MLNLHFKTVIMDMPNHVEEGVTDINLLHELIDNYISVSPYMSVISFTYNKVMCFFFKCFDDVISMMEVWE